MAARTPEKKGLSKGILEMKFMKRSKEKFVREKDEEEGRAMFASEVTEAMRIGGSKFIIEHSFVPCEGLVMGRFSFYGMNPEIENLSKEGNKNPEPQEKNDMEISDAEMARRYSSLIGTIGNKFKSKRTRKFEDETVPQKRPRFIKPKFE